LQRRDKVISITLGNINQCRCTTQNGGLPLFEFGGANGLGNLGAAGTLPSDKASNILQVTENVSIDRSRHQIRTGFEFQNVAFPMATPTAPRGDFVHSGIFTSVVNNTDGSTDRAQFILNPIAATVPGGVNLLGGANSLTATSFPPAFYPIRNYYAVYFQDSWRARPNLTLNLGLRYEFIGVPAERDGRVGNFVAAATGDTPDLHSKISLEILQPSKCRMPYGVERIAVQP